MSIATLACTRSASRVDRKGAASTTTPSTLSDRGTRATRTRRRTRRSATSRRFFAARASGISCLLACEGAARHGSLGRSRCEKRGLV
eukprot:scaffold3726_cov270-Pinguiococcus_pyrenoidosus.AAC.12